MSWESKLKAYLEERTVVESTDKTVASVLVPVGAQAQTGRWQVLLTKRTMKVDTHKGQISFPGGIREASDADLVGTALRESEEEIGISPSHIEVWGRLDPVWTRQSVAIYPWLGRIPLPYHFKMNKEEVERLIFMDLDYLVQEALTSVQVQIGGFCLESQGIYVENELIWGATARILDQLRSLMIKFPFYSSR